jgi:putative FmdB family regulatory protein
VPIYVYECDQCNGRFEYSQKMADPPMTVCETCGGKLQKIIVPIAFHLKGGGWYKDLYSSTKGGGDSKSSSSSSEGGGGGEGKSETKTESKGESKTDSKPSGSGSSST